MSLVCVDVGMNIGSPWRRGGLQFWGPRKEGAGCFSSQIPAGHGMGTVAGSVLGMGPRSACIEGGSAPLGAMPGVLCKVEGGDASRATPACVTPFPAQPLDRLALPRCLQLCKLVFSFIVLQEAKHNSRTLPIRVSGWLPPGV